MKINWDSILTKAKKRMEDPDMKKRMEEKMDRIMFGIEVSKNGIANMYDVGDTFAAVLYDVIRSSGLHPSVKDKLIDTHVGEPRKLSNGNYMITVSFSEDLERESMSTLKDYGYNVNLARLYNNGVDHMMQQLFERRGANKDILLVSNTDIRGVHFAEEAERLFKEQYGKRYHIVDITDNFDE